MLGQNLKQLYESLGPVGCTTLLQENLASGEFKPEDFSFAELAQAFCGHEWYNRLNPRNVGRFSAVPVTEAGEGVDVSAFTNITGQLFFNKIMDGWKAATYVTDRLVTTMPTRLDGEKMPWLANLTGEGQTEIRPGMPYPETGFGERYIETPRTVKYGEIVSLTKEAIFFDLTGQMLRQANSVGMRMGQGKAKRIWDVVLGLVNNYKLNGTTNNTYQASTPWVNTLGSWPLVDYTSVEKGYIFASQMTDPDTSNPIQVMLRQLIVMPAKLFTARRIVNATAVITQYPDFSASSTAPPGNVRIESSNPLPTQLEILSDPYAYFELTTTGGKTGTQANDYWLIGDFPQAFAYMENWPITLATAPAQSIKEFEQDIVVRVKGSERGVAAVIEPRQAFLFYNT